MPAPKLPNNLSEWKSNFFGYVKPSLYEVAFSGTVWTEMQRKSGAGSEVSKLVTRNCEVVALPGTAVSTQPNRIYGPAREMPYEKLYAGDLQMTFRMDESMYLRTFFNFWHDVIHDKVTGDFNYSNHYTSDILIYQYATQQAETQQKNRQDHSASSENQFYEKPPNQFQLQLELDPVADYLQKPIYGVRLIECYPKLIGEIELGYAQNDTYMKQTVDFAYRKWEEIPSDEY